MGEESSLLQRIYNKEEKEGIKCIKMTTKHELQHLLQRRIRIRMITKGKMVKRVKTQQNTIL